MIINSLSLVSLYVVNYFSETYTENALHDYETSRMVSSYDFSVGLVAQQINDSRDVNFNN